MTDTTIDIGQSIVLSAPVTQVNTLQPTAPIAQLPEPAEETTAEVTPPQEIPQREGWLPKDQRKKILLLSDDFRMPSGVGVISRDLVIGTAHRYNWIQLGAAIQHPEAGRGIDVSDSITKEFGVKDAYARIFPYNGYGDQNIVRFLIESEKPDAIMHFTDPRFWGWLYQMEHEIRSKIPLLYYHVWDDTPYPRYNRDFYRSCDAIYTISKQTHNIVRQVVGDENVTDVTSLNI